MAFGDRLAAVRRSHSLTQEQFAEQLQVSRQAVSKWESGRGYPEMEKILYICNRYQVSIADLFADEAPVSPAPAAPAATAEPPLPRATLGRAVGAFLTNLSPKNKWLAGAALVGIGALAGIIGLILRGGDADMATTIWIAAIIIFGVVEAATAGLTSIWFVLGGIAGLIAAVCGGPIWLQVALFFAVVGSWWGYENDLGVFAAAMVGGLIGFLVYNFHPAKVFMGDTGSLFLGGAVAGLAFAYDMPLVLLLVGIVYICETLSDIIQVAYFKATHGKRIFKMAPLHHHFELCGWSEVKLVTIFTLVSAVFCMLALWGVIGRYHF